MYCPQCGIRLPEDARFCAKCGRGLTPEAQLSARLDQSRPRKKDLPGWVVAIVFGGVIVVIIMMIIIAVANRPPTHVNPNDAQALHRAFETEASIACSSGADAYLRSIAKYDFKWDETGSKFDEFRPFVAKPGVLVMTTLKAKLQNGFGAYQRIELDCEYDTQTDTVLRYSFRQENTP